MTSKVVLSEDWLIESAPFHIAVDRKGRVVQSGRLLCRFLKEESIGTHILDHFDVARPAPTAVPLKSSEEDWLDISTNNIWILNHRDSPLKIKGSWQVHGEHALLLANLWVFNLEELDTLGLQLFELPTHDQTADYLFLLQQQVTTIEEMQELINSLAEAKDAAHAASKAKSSFLASMSHEIRTPLNGVIGMGELLRQSKLDKDQRKLLQVMQSSSGHLMQVINDILDFSKVEAGELQLTPAPVDLKRLVKDVVAVFKPLSEQKQIRLSRKMDSEIPRWIELDGTRLKQVLMNLLSNAIKFTPASGSVAMEVAYTKPNLKISVQDSGAGISEDDQKKIFAPFKQSEEGTLRGAGGTGLGLSISKHIVQLLGGTLELESKLGVGSTFTIEFEVAECSHQVKTRKRNNSRYQGRALIVDDSNVNLMVARHLLKKIGFETEEASDGRIAVSLMIDEDEDFDVIFMDCHMPEMNGFEATKAIREINSTVPIIALTADVFEDTSKACLKAGMNTVLTKPISMPEMYEVLDRCLPEQNIQPVN